jgi:hypothetical protein
MSLATLATYSNNRITPAQNPEDARVTAGAFDLNQVLPAGQVLATKGNTGTGTNTLLVALGGTNTHAVGILMYAINTDANGNVFLGGSTNASEVNPPFQTSPYFTAGTFDPADLTGWSATATTSLNMRITAAGFYKF